MARLTNAHELGSILDDQFENMYTEINVLISDLLKYNMLQSFENVKAYLAENHMYYDAHIADYILTELE
jgi:hypothetical protein